MSSIGDRLKSARERKNLKQVQVKERTGINNKTLSGYEKGVSEPDIETLKTLASLYEVSVDWLSGNTDDPQPKSKNEQAKNAVIEAYNRLPSEKKKIVDDMIKALSD